MIEHAVAEDDLVAVRCAVSATHKGHGIGIEPTHKPTAFTGMSLVRIKDGKIVESWNNFDFLNMYRATRRSANTVGLIDY